MTDKMLDELPVGTVFLVGTSDTTKALWCIADSQHIGRLWADSLGYEYEKIAITDQIIAWFTRMWPLKRVFDPDKSPQLLALCAMQVDEKLLMEMLDAPVA